MLKQTALSLLLALAVVSCGSDSGEQTKPISEYATAPAYESYDAALAVAKEEDKPLYVEFYTDW